MLTNTTTLIFRGLASFLSIFSLATWAQEAGSAPVSERHDRPTVSRRQAGQARTYSWIRGENVAADGRPMASGSPGGIHPDAMRTAYGVNAIAGSTGGAGMTIAIVDAYDSPSAEADLNFFSAQFGLPACTSAAGCFTKVGQTGTADLPQRDSGWEVEINLDVQWAHAMAPNARILLVEARTPSTADLIAAVDYAKQHANVVSMSWGSNEFGGQAIADAHLVAPGVTFVASSGDTGGVVGWPASSTNVIAVGGTQLVLDPNTNAIVSETAWGTASTGRRGMSGSGGGCSTREFQPSYQLAVLPFSPACARRAIPDIAMAGGNASAVSVYVSMQGGWFGVYGTSLSAPMWAGLVAVADAMRGSAGSLNAVAADLYAAGAGYFNDVTVGNAGSFAAGPGWDFITGLGSPRASMLIPYLVQRGR